MALSWSTQPRDLVQNVYGFVNSGGSNTLAKEGIVTAIRTAPLLSAQARQALGEKLWGEAIR